MPSPQQTPTAEMEHHKPELDGLRGIAILAVLLTHSVTVMHLLPDTILGRLLNHIFVPGWAGVDLFFVLSGFLITGILLRTRQSPNYYKSFYMRRFLRIFPLYYAVITILLLVGCVPLLKPFIHLHTLLPVSAIDKSSYYLYLQNWPIPNCIIPAWTGAYWSLAVEEQFYLVWPFLVLALRPRTLLRLCISGFFVALVLRILWMHYFPESFAAMRMTPTRMDGLLVGAACALLMTERKSALPMSWIRAALLSGGVIILFIAVWTHGHELIATSTWMQTIGVTGFALLGGGLLALSQHHPPMLQRVLTLRPLRSFGKYSYGIYMYHSVLFSIIGLFYAHYHYSRNFTLGTPVGLLIIGAAIALCYLVAKISFDYFEMRFLMLKRHFRATETGR
ncbi:MAG TPA: acyltransferase [Acidobacteriaceae bacterium]